ncbi:MAG: hypothetical protein ACREQ5_03645 [Candidatus Dormibacteria bacterium]
MTMNENTRPATIEDVSILASNQVDIIASVRELRKMLQDHVNTQFTRAHPRNGFPEEVLQYLGLDLEENAVVIAPVPKDNRAEAKAEEVV